MDDEWRNLLESSTNLTLGHSASRINRSLKGIEKEAQRLSSKSSRHIAANQLKDFAAQAGVDIRNQTQYISSIDSLSIQNQHVQQVHNVHTKPKQKQTEPMTVKDIQLISGSMHPTNTMDLNNFLKYHHEYVISSTIQESQLLSARHFRKKYTQSLEQEWHQTKKDILSYLGCNTVICAPAVINHNHNLNNSNINNNNNNNNNDVCINSNNNNNNNDNEIFEERLGEIIVHLSKYHRNIASPMIDFDRSNTEQSVWRNNIFAPISKIAMIHNEQQQEKEQQQHETENKDNEYLCDLWQCLSSMIFETGINLEQECFLKENEYRSYYENNHKSLALQRLLAIGARKYLEKIYFDFIEKEIERNKSFAKKGGKPGKQYIICAFVRLKYQNGSALIPKEYKTIMMNNEVFPLWPLVYYSFRVGDLDSAINFLQYDDSLSSTQIKKSLNNLREKMFKFAQITSGNKDMTFILNQLHDTNLNFNELDGETWKELDSFYKQHVLKRSRDPFEIIMYILIGKLFMGPPPDLITNVMNRQEDFLWFKLVTLYFNINTKPQWVNIDTNGSDSVWIPSLSLKDLQNELKNEIGPSHYSNRILYVKSLILSQQFEDAVLYLSQFNRFESIHIGICLLFYGLIKSATNSLQRDIEHYIVSKFKFKNECAHFIFYYLYIISCEDKLIDFLCEPNTNLRQLVIGTTNNESIDISNGLLYTFCGEDKFIKITKLSAQKALENGEIEHCILLYILCGDFNSSAGICIKLLCSHITDKRTNHAKQFIVNLAKHLYSANKQISQNRNFHCLSLINDSLIIRMNSMNTTNLICGIHFAEFYDLFYEQQIDKALNIININDFIPINLNQSSMHFNANQCEEKVSRLYPDLQKYIGDICVAVMRLLFMQFQSFRNNKQFENITNISKKCENIYNYFNNLEHKIKPIGAGGDTAKEISNLYFQTRLD